MSSEDASGSGIGIPSTTSIPSSTAYSASQTLWLESIDATYTLFENDDFRNEYPRLSKLVKDAVTLCEEVVDEFG